MDNKEYITLPDWTEIISIHAVLSEIRIYPELTTQRARRDFLEAILPALRKLDWKPLSAYWGYIAKEIVDHWVTLMVQAAQQAREWLRLEI